MSVFKPIYSLQYRDSRGNGHYPYWKSPKAAIKHAMKVKAELEARGCEHVTIKFRVVHPGGWYDGDTTNNGHWYAGMEYRFSISLDECATTPGYQMAQSFVSATGARHTNFYRNCRYNCDYHGWRADPVALGSPERD